jgi:hypothetical protein
MHPLSAAELLRVWELGVGQQPVDRAITILAAASPEWPRGDLAALSVGQRDSLLLGLRELTFGPRLDCFAACPRCGERLEFAMTAQELRAAQAAQPAEPELALSVEEYQVTLRLPNSLDLAAIARCRDVETARSLLIERCVLKASRAGEQIPVKELPAEIVEAAAGQMSERDPLAEVRFDVQCPDCGHAWPLLLEIASFLWAEVEAEARRLLREVHTLARAYAWRETDILAMSARRRQSYLEMVTQ